MNLILNFEEFKKTSIDERCPDLKQYFLDYEDLIKILDAIIYEFPSVTESAYIKDGIAMLASIRCLKESDVFK